MRKKLVNNKNLSLVFLLALSLACSTLGQEKRQLTGREKARLLVELANGALVEGDPTGALENLIQAEHYDSSLPELHHTRALAYFAKKGSSKGLFLAIESARKAVRLKPDYSDASNTLGKLLIESGEPGEAEPILTKAAEDQLYRDSYKAWTNLGTISYHRADWEAAQKYFEHAIQDSPAKACIAYYYRGQIFQQRKNLRQAIRDFQDASHRYCNDFSKARLALGLAYKENKELELARKTLVEIQTLHPRTEFAEQALKELSALN